MLVVCFVLSLEKKSKKKLIHTHTDLKPRMLLIQTNEHTTHMTTAVIYVVLQRIGSVYVRYQFVNFHRLLIEKMMMHCCWKMASIRWCALIVTSI